MLNVDFYDEVILDVVPYLYDRNVSFLRKKSEYQFEKYGKLYILRYYKSRNPVIISG